MVTCYSESTSSKYPKLRRRPKAFAIRSFPLRCGPNAANGAPPQSENVLSCSSDQKSPLSPSSFSPKRRLIFYGGKFFKPPAAFAVRDFPSGCVPHSASITKPSEDWAADDGKDSEGKKPYRKRPLPSDSSECSHQLPEARGDRLIVLALMAAKSCPWMQGKGRGSISLQSRAKKPRN